MMKYVVTKRETHQYEQVVEAASREDALAIAGQGEWPDEASSVEMDGPELDDVSEMEDFRQFDVTIRQVRQFVLKVRARDEEEAEDMAYKMNWPESAWSITQQTCYTEEVGDASN